MGMIKMAGDCIPQKETVETQTDLHIACRFASTFTQPVDPIQASSLLQKLATFKPQDAFRPNKKGAKEPKSEGESERAKFYK
jgi:hypothetical protein